MFRIIAAALAAVMLSACASALSGDYASGKSKTLLVEKDAWSGYQDYLSKIGNGTYEGAFAVQVMNDRTYGFVAYTCGGGRCEQDKNPATLAMRDCEGHGAPCVLFARSGAILVNYKLDNGA